MDLTQLDLFDSPSLTFRTNVWYTNKWLGADLGQWTRKVPHVIYYASKVLDLVHCDYTTMETEIYDVVFALENF